MNIDLAFDLCNTRYVEFGIGRDVGDDQVFHTVPIGDKAQNVLKEVVADTWSEMLKSVQGQPTQTKFEATLSLDDISAFTPVSDEETMRHQLEGGPVVFDIAEKYAGTEYVYLPTDDKKVSVIKNLHEAHLDMTTDIFSDVASIFCYFMRMIDNDGHRLTAIKRATTFKGLAHKGNLLGLTANVLEIMDDNVFKLDSSFDILIDNDRVHIWRANSFEAIGKLREEILHSVGDNVEAIKYNLNYVDFGPIGQYASQHINGARYLASIRAQLTDEPINRRSLMKLCNDTGVRVSERDGMIVGRS